MTRFIPSLIDVIDLKERMAALHGQEGDADNRRRAALALVQQADGTALAEGARRLEAQDSGLTVARGLAKARDAWITALAASGWMEIQAAARGDAETQPMPLPVAVVATGGYGRAAMAPHSDLDIMLLIPDGARDRETDDFLSWLLYALWDTGLRVGHAIRTPAECLSEAAKDHIVCTSLLESRFVHGDRALFAQFQSDFRADILAQSNSEFIEAKLAERSARHERAGNVRYVVEPNVKEGKGGLRDIHTLYWIARYVYGIEKESDLVDLGVLSRPEYRSFRRALHFLWSVRCHLHYMTGRAEERLTFDLQIELARRMGYPGGDENQGVEAFMKSYFLVAKDVGTLTGILCAGLEERHRIRPEKGYAQGLDHRPPPFEDLLIRNGRVDLADIRALRKDPLNIMRAFHLAAMEQRKLAPHALKLIRRCLPLIDEGLRASPEANGYFLDILCLAERPEANLRRMNEAGVLGAFIPEFGRVVAQMQFNMYHHYTVDEHLLRVVGGLAAILKGQLAESDPFSTKVARNVTQRRALFLAGFCHDIAKGQHGDHSEIGAAIGRSLAERFGFTRTETETVGWLIEHHLMMSEYAQRRDLSDPQTISGFAERVQTLERLRLLHTLTAADIRAVGPGVWNAWKGDLMRTLYRATAAFLKGEGARQDMGFDNPADLLAPHIAAWPDKDQARARARFAQDQWLGMPEADLVAQADLARTLDGLRAAGDTDAIAFRGMADPRRGVLDLLVCARDRPGLFAGIVGAISLSGGNIVDARAVTLGDGTALDRFALQDASGAAFETGQRLTRMEETIRAALSGALDLSAQIRRSHLGERATAFTVPPQAVMHNDLSDVASVLEVMARNRPGLLYDLAELIRDLKLSISAARISTYGERAVDVFYVKDSFGLKIDNPRRARTICDAIEAGLGERQPEAAQ